MNKDAGLTDFWKKGGNKFAISLKWPIISAPSQITVGVDACLLLSLFLLSSLCRYCCRWSGNILLISLSPSLFTLSPALIFPFCLQGISTRWSTCNTAPSSFLLADIGCVQRDPSWRLPGELGRGSGCKSESGEGVDQCGEVRLTLGVWAEATKVKRKSHQNCGNETEAPH